MARSLNQAAIQRAQEVLGRGGSKAEAARAAEVDPRTITTWVQRGLLKDASPGSPSGLHPSDASGRPSRPVAAEAAGPVLDGRALATRASAAAARAKAEEAEALVQKKRAERDLARMEAEEREEAERKTREEQDRIQEEQERRARERQEEERRRREAAERAAREDRERRARAWRREEHARLVRQHVPADALPEERAKAVEVLRHLVDSATPDSPPSLAAVEATLIPVLAAFMARTAAAEREARVQREEEARREAVEQRRLTAFRLLRAKFPWGTTTEEQRRAERDLEARLVDEPRLPAEDVAAAVVRDLEAEVEARREAARRQEEAEREAQRTRERAEREAKVAREEAERRPRDAHHSLEYGFPWNTSPEERAEAKRALDARLATHPTESASEAASAILNDVRARVQALEAEQRWRDSALYGFRGRLDAAITGLRFGQETADDADLQEALSGLDRKDAEGRFQEALADARPGDPTDGIAQDVVDDLLYELQERVDEDREDR